MNWAWGIRGFVDRMMGGAGVRRGRRDPDYLEVGDALDFWRVETVEHERLLRLRAEMRLPGRAWLQFEVTPYEKNRVLLSQTVFFEPRGLLGRLYWYCLFPLHALIFRGLFDRLAEEASRPKINH